jgi:hypothetical protein
MTKLEDERGVSSIYVWIYQGTDEFLSLDNLAEEVVAIAVVGEIPHDALRTTRCVLTCVLWHPLLFEE